MTENPFEDPEVAEFMKQHGIVHTPGMAQEMLEELAPLLAAEGVDLDDPEGFESIEELNAALGRAVEQRNLHLMNPVSAERDLTHEFLLEVTELLAAGKLRDAERAVESIEPEPTATRPPASHVIGEGLGLLDTWHSDADLGPALADAKIPKWRGPAKSTARRLLASARRREAYASLDSLLIQHGGLFVMHSVILAVAATISAHAAAQGSRVPQAAAELFEHSGTPAGPGSAFGFHAPPHSADRDAYRAWLEADPENTPEEVDLTMAFFASLEEISAAENLSIDDADEVSYLVDVVLDIPDAGVIDTLMANLVIYTRFRMDTGPEDWESTHADVIGVMDELHPEHRALMNAVEVSQEIPEPERRSALLETRALGAVPALLEWIGESRPVTQTGNLRRVDISPAARFLGLYVEGVAKRPSPSTSRSGHWPGEHPDSPLYVQSMHQVPLLAALWRALQIQEVITITSTTVRPGPRRDAVFGDDADYDAVERFAAVVIMETLLQHAQDGGSYAHTLVDFTLARLIDALNPEGDQLTDPDSPLAGKFIERELAEAGFITFEDDALIHVPDTLKGAVGAAIFITIQMLQSPGE